MSEDTLARRPDLDGETARDGLTLEV